MKCKHYKRAEYKHKFNGEILSLCSNCEMELLKEMNRLVEMKRLEIIEKKYQLIKDALDICSWEKKPV